MRHAIVSDSNSFVSSKHAATKNAPSLADALAADAKWLKCVPPCVDPANTVSLKGILPSAEFFSDDDVEFHSIATKASAAQPGQLVVYRIGEGDPMKLIATAMARGAAGILTEQMLPCPLPQCIVADVERSSSQINAALLDHPDCKLLTIGVIGSAGKTTTSLLVSSLLRGSGTRTAYQTDLGDCDGVVQSTPTTTLPCGDDLLSWLGEAVDGQCQAAVMELNDQDARHGKYDAMQFDLLVVTGNASLSNDFGPSGLHCLLERLKGSGVVVAPSEDTKGVQIIRESGCRLLTYSARHAADVSAKIVDQSCGMTTMMVTEGDTSAMLETALCGASNANNLMAAAAVGILVDQPLQQVVQSLATLRAIPGRNQRLSDFQHATAVLDIAGTPQRAAATMQAARNMKAGGQLWCVLAIDEKDTSDSLARYGQLLERFANKAVVTCSRSMKGSFLSASHKLLDGVQECAAMRLVADSKRAIEWAVGEAKPGDTILVLGGVDTSDAHRQRTEIRQLVDWIETARSEKELPSEVAETPNPSIIPMKPFQN